MRKNSKPKEVPQNSYYSRHSSASKQDNYSTKHQTTTKLRISDYLQSTIFQPSIPSEPTIDQPTHPISIINSSNYQNLLATIQQLKLKDAESRLSISKLQQQNAFLKKELQIKDQQLQDCRATIHNDRNYIGMLDQQVRRLKQISRDSSCQHSLTNTPGKSKQNSVQLSSTTQLKKPAQNQRHDLEKENLLLATQIKNLVLVNNKKSKSKLF